MEAAINIFMLHTDPAIAALRTATNEVLIESFGQWRATGFADPRMTAVIQQAAEGAKAELLRRLTLLD